MDIVLDDKDREIIRILQKEFPISDRPYLEIANRLNIQESELISRLKLLFEKKIIRKIGAVVNPKKIGYVSLLGAINIAENKVDEVAKIINAYEGVTHNYIREGQPNIWFTIVEPNAQILENNLTEIEKKIGTNILRMPVTKMFKIGVHLDI